MKRRILIIDDHDDLRPALEAEFSGLGHEVVSNDSRTGALREIQSEPFDMVITDLDVVNEGVDPARVFRLSAQGLAEKGFDDDELKRLVELTLAYKLEHVDRTEVIMNLRELIEFEIPSSLAVMHSVLGYLIHRVERLGVVAPERSNLFVALDEAFVNAVKHGNRFDSRKTVRIAADVSAKEARFTIEDEGEGFDVNTIPDPRDPANLFRDSGRGVLLIYNIMDEVRYNERGNRLTMVIRPASEPKGPAQ